MEDRQPTPEEIKDYQEKRIVFYEEHLPFLRMQCEYETLNCCIVEYQLRKKEALIKLAELEMGQRDAKKKVEEKK